MIEQRSVLSRSPTLAALFASKHYLEGTDTILWFLNVHSTVLLIAIQYLFFGHEWLVPTLPMYTSNERIYIYVRVYFLAKRLELQELEDRAFFMLTKYKLDIGPEEIIDMAPIIYENPDEKDARIRNYFQGCVQKYLRQLLTLQEWRVILRDTRPSFAADMFELVATLYMDGHASSYPPKLPLPTIELEYRHILESPPVNSAVLRHRSSALSQVASKSERCCSEKFVASDSLRHGLGIQSATDGKECLSSECSEIFTEEATVQEIIVDSRGSPQRVTTVFQNTSKAARVLGLHGPPMDVRALSNGDRKGKGKKFLSKFSPRMA